MKKTIFIILTLFYSTFSVEFVAAAKIDCNDSAHCASGNYAGCGLSPAYCEDTTHTCECKNERIGCNAFKSCKIIESKGLETNKDEIFTMTNPFDNLQVKLPGVLNRGPECVYDEKTKKPISCKFFWIGDYIVWLFKYSLGVAGIIATIMIMFGGFRWMMAGGDSSAIGDAKKYITGAVTGLVLLMTSYLILFQINPDLVVMKPITLGVVQELEEQKLANSKSSKTSEQFKNMACPSSSELSGGVEFYATGYYKPPHNDNNLSTLCKIAMQCDCTTFGSSRDSSGVNCDQLYGKSYPGYKPCTAFPIGSSYCNKNSSGVEPQIGTIAADWSCLPQNTQICVNKGGSTKTYIVKDKGSGIKGRRIDIWTGSSLSDANGVTGKVTIKSGACN